MSEVQAAAVLLYVEDEPITRELVQDVLTEAGFELMVATDGLGAMKLIEENHGTFHGLVTDINLGHGPDGFDIARRARELADTLPVVYVSGASGHQWNSKGVPHSVMIVKPFAPTQIVVAISTLLNSTDP